MPVLGVDGAASIFTGEVSTDEGGDMSGVEDRSKRAAPAGGTSPTPSETERNNTRRERQKRTTADGAVIAKMVIESINLTLGVKLESVSAKVDRTLESLKRVEDELSDHKRRIMDLEAFMVEAKNGKFSNMGSSVGGGSSDAGERGAGGGGRSGGLPTFFRRVEVVLGGFERDTPRDEIVEWVRKFLKLGEDGATPGVVDVFTAGPKASVCKIRFDNPGSVWNWIRLKKGKDELYKEKRMWWTVERTMQERNINKRMSTAATRLSDELAAKGIVPDEKKKSWIGIEWNKCQVWVRVQGGRPIVVFEAEDDDSTYLKLIKEGADSVCKEYDWEACLNYANAIV